jgi:hypothetical protein
VSTRRNPGHLGLLVLGVPAVVLAASVTVTSCAAGGGSGGSASTPLGSAGSTPASPVPETSRSSATPSGTHSKVAPVPVESNPPGDIPDNLAFVRYTNAAGGYQFTHPEGWAQTGSGAQVRFTDKLNGVAAQSAPAPSAPTLASARTTDVPRLARSVPAFHLRRMNAVSLPGGRGVRIVFRRNSDPDPATGKVYRDEVEEYLVFRAGRVVRLDLFGPVGADNVDAYRTMSRSLRIR